MTANVVKNYNTRREILHDIFHISEGSLNLDYQEFVSQDGFEEKICFEHRTLLWSSCDNCCYHVGYVNAKPFYYIASGDDESVVYYKNFGFLEDWEGK